MNLEIIILIIIGCLSLIVIGFCAGKSYIGLKYASKIDRYKAKIDLLEVQLTNTYKELKREREKKNK